MKKKKLIGLCLSFLISVNTTFSQDAECLTFDGTDDYVVADNDALNAIGTGDFTVEAWVNGELAGQNAHPTIFSNRPVSGVGMTFFFHNIWGGSLYKMLSVQLGGINYFVFNNGTYDATFFDGTCHHVAVSREGTTLNFYADGVFFGTREMRVDLTTASVGDLWIGKDLPTNNSYEGNISQLRIWDVVRTADEILDNKDLSIPGDSPNLVGYWELNDGSGQVATDKTGTADGQLGSSPSADGLDPIWGRLCCIAGCEPLTTVVSTTDICIGGEVTLEATSEIGGTITWSDGVENGVPFTIDAEGVYTYIATSDDDADCEFEVEITVHGPPEVVAAVDEEIICLGQSVFFYGLGADTYVWDNDVLDRVEYTPTEVGLMTYTVTGTSEFGCVNTASVDVLVTPGPDVDFEFIADGVSSEDGSTGGCIINPVQFNDLTNIDPPGVITEWEWRFGDGATSTLENPEHTYGAPGTYTVTLTVITEGGCEVTITKEITMVESISIDIISNEPSCFGFSDGSIIINILGGGGGDDVVYEIKDVDGNVLNIDNSNAANSLKAGTYTYSIDDGTACSGTGTVVLSQPEQLDIDITTFDPLCFGDKTGWARINEVFNATGDNDRIAYIWNPNPAGTSGIGADSTWNLGVGEYAITINDENGCSNVFDFIIDQPDSLKLVEFEFEPAYCRLYDYQKGNGVVKAALAGGVADYGYLWTNLQTGETSTNSTWGGLNPGEYQMVATDANGCTLTETITVDSLNPRANFEITSDQFTSNYKGTAEIDAHFVNLSEHFANPFNPLADTTFFWNFDSPQGMWILSEDLNESFDKIYEPRDDSYDVDVCLVAINKNGCTDTLCKNIIVYSPIEFDNVNIFSPNGDGANDLFTFEFKSKSIAEFKCVIVDRWGITKTEMSAITDTWDGTDMNGSKCNDGVYFYTYEAITDNGTTLVGQGTVQIVGGGK